MLGVISLRELQERDRAFLGELYASTRQEELAQVPWSEEQKWEFLQMQLSAQERHHAAHFPTAQLRIIELLGQPIGRLYVDRSAEELRIVDIALLPPWRDQGLGRGLLEDVLVEARATSRIVRVHVEHLNPAARLYERLGFKRIKDRGVYILMEWRPRSEGDWSC